MRPSPFFSAFVLACSVAALSLPLACSGGDSSAGPTDPGTGTGGSGGDGGPSEGGTPDASDSSDEHMTLPDGGCPSQILCGVSGTCCDVGEECFEGACMTACASGVHCAGACCDTGQVCLSSSCVDPGASCMDSFDCEEGEFCEPTLAQCLPQPTSSSTCEWRPPPSPFEPMLEWQWPAAGSVATVLPEYDQVINMPAVLDMDGDDVPDLAVVTSEHDGSFGADNAAVVRLLDGRTGLEKWGAGADAYLTDNQVNPRGTPAVADIDGDGHPELIVPRRGRGAIAFRADGSLLWRSEPVSAAANEGVFSSVTVAIADMDGDGKAEIVLGGVVYDHEGHVVSGAGREKLGSNDVAYGPVSIIADVDGNDATTDQQVIGGNAAYRKDGTAVWHQSGLTDGYPAIADFEQDGTAELVVVAQGEVRIQNAFTGELLAAVTMPGQGRGGPPTIADFDADGTMEIAAANGSAYAVFEYDHGASPMLSVKWSKDTQDQSSNVTGSSVFDFEGDGAAEVLYNDECYSRVYSGSDGTVLFSVANSSGTIHEYPVLVDVDGDHNTEYVIVANDRNHRFGLTPCGDYQAGEAPRTGVFVYGDAADRWVRTRKLWNQHAYHITNILADGTLPAQEIASWSPGANNNYRVSEQGAGSYNAPDLTVDLEVSTALCPSIELRARVKNEGTLGVAAGIEVAFYAGADATAPLLATKSTTKSLLPGASEVVTHVVPPGAGIADAYFVTVDGTNTAAGLAQECLEDNNDAGAGKVICPVVH